MLIGVGVILLLSALADGWPSLGYGFDWVGYGNDDMTNYCLGAQRFLTHGFYAVPNPADLAGGDYPQYFWMLHVAGLIRFGSEHLLAYIAGATGLKPIQIFMPVTIALTLVQICAVVGLTLSIISRWRQALLAGALLALLPLWHCGTMYQLIAQVGGLALLVTLLALTTRTRFPRYCAGRLCLAAVVAILLASLCISYPEVLPFFALGWAICVAHRSWRARRWPRELIAILTPAALLIVLILRQNVLSTLFTLLGQMHDGLSQGGVAARVSLFPYFLMPAGPAFFLGFDVLVNRYAEPHSSIAVAAGLLCCAGLSIVWLRGFRQMTASGAVLAVMILVGTKLFAAQNGFGLFKLAMFALPFLAVFLATGLVERGRFWKTTGMLCLFIPIWAFGIWRYTHAATPEAHNTVGELYDATVSRGTLPPTGTTAWAETTSSPVNKLLMLEAPGSHPEFLSQVVAATIMGRAAVPFPPWVWKVMPSDATGETAKGLVQYIETAIYSRQQELGLSFWARRATAGAPTTATPVISSSPERQSFNKLANQPHSPSEGLFRWSTTDQLSNHLVFIQSIEGQHYYLGKVGQIAVYRPQPDIYDERQQFFAIGRHLLFRVLNPASEPIRVRFSMTCTILGAGRTALPATAFIRHSDHTESQLGLVGAGSANIFSSPLRPCTIDGTSYLALDLGADPIPLGLPARGINGLYNRELSTDTRLALGYCRDISLITDSEYQARPARRAVCVFPADLLGPDAVEYSGLYEDGWMAAEGFVVLGPVAAGETISVLGERPLLANAPQQMEAELRIDGAPPQRITIAPGPFRLELRAPQAARRIRVELRFSHTGVLRSPDDRPASVHIRSIQIEPST
jgi:hypothetical protein